MRSEYLISVGISLAVALWIVIVIMTNRKQHPKVLFWLFMVELWERFSYYGNRGLLVLYLTRTAVEGGFGVSKPVGNGIYGAYVALVYLTPLLGGYLADKYLGFRKSIIWGASLMALGQFTLFASYEAQPVYLQTVIDMAEGLGSEKESKRKDAEAKAAEFAKDEKQLPFLKQLVEQAKFDAKSKESAENYDKLLTALKIPIVPIKTQAAIDLAKDLNSDVAATSQAAQTKVAEALKDAPQRSALKKLTERATKDAEEKKKETLGKKETEKNAEELTKLDTALAEAEKQLVDLPKLQSALGGKLDASKGDLIDTVQESSNNKLLMYIGLSLLVLGNGFFKPNISSLIGKFYQAGDPRRDGAFTIFYMGINIGAFIAPLTCGTVGEVAGWGYCFLMAGCGMVTGLIIFLVTVKKGLTEDKAEPPRTHSFPAEIAIYIGSFGLVAILCGLLYKNEIMDYLLGAIGLGMILFIIALSFKYPKVERQRLWVITVLLLFTTVFWTFFELAGSAINLFTDKNVDKRIFWVDWKTSNFQAVNALFIMIFAPVFSFMWIYLARRNQEPAAPLKFASALFLLGAGFLVLNAGTPFASEAMVPVIFLILLYLLHTWGELALSPVGLSLVTKMAPAQIVAFIMGFWFLSSSIAGQAGAWISNLTTVDDNAPKELALEQAMKVFNQIGFVALGCGVVLLLLSPILKKWMHGIK